MQLRSFRSAFTMIELIFVIIIIGILAAIAIPRFSGVESQAVIASGRSTVMSVRAAISTERQKYFMLGDSSYINRLDANVATNTSDVKIFDNNGTATDVLLTYPIITKNASGGWMKTGSSTYTYNINGNLNTFTYNSTNGTFTCTSGTYCKQLSQ